MAPRRRREGGSAIVVFAVSSIALIAVTGLAIDGGMAAGAFRHAHNAADAGALAAARQEYLDLASTPAVLPGADQLSSVAEKEVHHNDARFVSATGGGLAIPGSSSSSSQSTYVPTSVGGISATAMLADVSTTVSTGAPGVPNLDAQLQVNSTQSQMSVAPTSGQSWRGSSASAQTAMAVASSTALGQNAYVNCWSAQAGYTSGSNTVGTPVQCPSGTLPTQVNVAGTLVSTASPDAEVDRNNVPSAKPSMVVLGESESINGVQVSANLVQSDNNLYWDPNSGITSLASVSATNFQMASGVVDVGAATLDMSASISYDPSAGHPQMITHCAQTSLAITREPAGTPVDVPLGPQCQPLGTLPSIPGVSIDFPYYSPGNTYSTVCSYNNGTGVWGCPQFQACLLRVTVAATATTACIGELDLGFNVAPVSMTGGGNNDSRTFPQFQGRVTVTATVPQQTYFMNVFGWKQTSPTAAGTADVESVVDETPAAFAASPFGIPADACEMDAPFTCTALQAGHEYYLYGPDMQVDSPSLYMSSQAATWQGQLAATSPHHVGPQFNVIPSASLTTTPQPYTGTVYYLEPVFDPAGGQILYYAVFLPVPSDPHLGLLVNSIPSLNGPIVVATSAAGWTVLDQGAVSVKLVQ